MVPGTTQLRNNLNCHVPDTIVKVKPSLTTTQYYIDTLFDVGFELEGIVQKVIAEVEKDKRCK